MISSLSSLLLPELVQLDLSANSDLEAISAVAGLLTGHPDLIGDPAQFRQAVLDREKLSPTALGYGVAFPHARTPQVKQIVVAVGRSREGVLFAQADQRVNLLFVIGTPLDKVPEYLAVVGRLVRLLKNEAVRRSLLAAETVDEFLAPLRSAG